MNAPLDFECVAETGRRPGGHSVAQARRLAVMSAWVPLDARKTKRSARQGRAVCAKNGDASKSPKGERGLATGGGPTTPANTILALPNAGRAASARGFDDARGGDGHALVRGLRASTTRVATTTPLSGAFRRSTRRAVVAPPLSAFRSMLDDARSDGDALVGRRGLGRRGDFDRGGLGSGGSAARMHASQQCSQVEPGRRRRGSSGGRIIVQRLSKLDDARGGGDALVRRRGRRGRLGKSDRGGLDNGWSASQMSQQCW